MQNPEVLVAEIAAHHTINAKSGFKVNAGKI